MATVLTDNEAKTLDAFLEGHGLGIEHFREKSDIASAVTIIVSLKYKILKHRLTGFGASFSPPPLRIHRVEINYGDSSSKVDGEEDGYWKNVSPIIESLSQSATMVLAWNGNARLYECGFADCLTHPEVSGLLTLITDFLVYPSDETAMNLASHCYKNLGDIEFLDSELKEVVMNPPRQELFEEK